MSKLIAGCIFTYLTDISENDYDVAGGGGGGAGGKAQPLPISPSLETIPTRSKSAQKFFRGWEVVYML